MILHVTKHNRAVFYVMPFWLFYECLPLCYFIRMFTLIVRVKLLKLIQEFKIYLSVVLWSWCWSCVSTLPQWGVECNSYKTPAAVASVSNPVRCASSSRAGAPWYIPVIGDWNAGTGSPTGPSRPRAHHRTHTYTLKYTRTRPTSPPPSSTFSHPSPGKSNAPPASAAAASVKTQADVNGRICDFWFYFMQQSNPPPRKEDLKRGDDTTHFRNSAGRESAAVGITVTS